MLKLFYKLINIFNDIYKKKNEDGKLNVIYWLLYVFW